MRIAFFLSILFFAPIAYASTGDNDTTCASWGSLAAKIIEWRQLETPMSRVIEIIDNDGTKTISRHIIMQAYEAPAYQVKESQQKAIDAFRNQIELQCFKAG